MTRATTQIVQSTALQGQTRLSQRIDDFFFVRDDNYDLISEQSLPSYHEAHEILVASLGLRRDQPATVLDLGTGTGVTAAYVLRHYPRAKVVAVDQFEEMLKRADQRLSAFGPGRYELHCDDLGDFVRAETGLLDAVVTGFAVHHLNADEKKRLFRALFNRLRPGGRFLMLDLTTFDDEDLRSIAQRETIRHMTERISDPAVQNEWINHWQNVNQPSSADTMVQWLRTAGLSAETVFRRYEVALIAATKPRP